MLDFDAPREIPDDPALQRLLPDAHRDDPEVAAEFRRFTERSLREGKVDDAIVVLRSLGADSGEQLRRRPTSRSSSSSIVMRCARGCGA